MSENNHDHGDESSNKRRRQVKVWTDGWYLKTNKFYSSS